MEFHGVTLNVQPQYGRVNQLCPDKTNESAMDVNYELQYGNHVLNVPSYVYSDDEDAGDEFSEGELREIEQFKNANSQTFGCPADDVTSQLLQFANRLNGDIEKYFRKYTDCILAHGENCQISKSGRELYYADLLRIARGSEDEEDRALPAAIKSYTGKMDEAVGLGPLSALFERVQDQGNCGTEGERDEEERTGSGQRTLPMNARKLPGSFFTEPQCRPKTSADRDKPDSGLLAPDNETPDFSDLLLSWTGEDVALSKS